MDNVIDIQNNIHLRNQGLKQIRKKTEEELRKLLAEIKADHQQILLQEARAENDREQAEIKVLRMEIEAQEDLIIKYHSIQYQKLIRSMVPKTPVAKNSIKAFLVGGLICSIGQLLINLFISLGNDFKGASVLASMMIVIATGILTGLGVYDEIGRIGGAGSMVPITGFANSVVSAALEFKREGFVYGVGAKIFTIAGPVILYGTLTSVIIGLIAFIFQ